MTFLERAVTGEFPDVHEALLDAVGEWHDTAERDGLPHLHEWLGFTWDEYGQWAMNSSALDDIIRSRTCIDCGALMSMTIGSGRLCEYRGHRVELPADLPVRRCPQGHMRMNGAEVRRFSDAMESLTLK